MRKPEHSMMKTTAMLTFLLRLSISGKPDHALPQRVGRRGSSHYGVCGDAVGQYVAESDVAWTNGNWASNCRAVTIEVSNSGGAPDWPVSGASLQTLARLVADIARRNGLGELVVGKNLTWHSMYAATACPGPYLKGKLAEIAAQANAINAKEVQPAGAQAQAPDRTVLYTVQVGAFKNKANAESYAAGLKGKGVDCIIIEKECRQ